LKSLAICHSQATNDQEVDSSMAAEYIAKLDRANSEAEVLKRKVADLGKTNDELEDENEHLLAKYDAAKGELDKTMAELNEMME
jgi:hypothetical protein